MTTGTPPATAIGVLDTGLRTALRFARDRTLYGMAVAELHYPRAILVDAFVDSLVCDCLAKVAARALSIAPGRTTVYGTAAAYVVPRLLKAAMYRLSLVLGAQFYICEGRYAIFEKLLHGLDPAGIAANAGAAANATVLMKLARLARQSWLSEEDASGELFRLDAELPTPFDRIAAGADDADGPFATPMTKPLEPPQSVIATELYELGRRLAEQPAGELTIMASPATFDLTSRYVMVFAATVCIRVWRHNQDRHDSFLRDPRWACAAVHRLVRSPAQESTPVPAELEQWLFATLLARHDECRSFDLAGSALSG